MTDQQREADPNPATWSSADDSAGLDPEHPGAGSGLQADPMAGEGTDDDEATISQGPRAGGTNATTGTGSSEEAGSEA
ncbi:MAG: hypothetical protein H0X16_07540 [Chloroflexi bacterium]|nr:hypothetical protein [Chloroflexota bacterium]